MKDGPLDAMTAYEIRHLVQHLYGAERDDDVHRLLALETPARANALYEAKEDAAAFLADVDLAQQLAERTHRPDLRVRYALVSASIRSRSGNLPPALLPALVDADLLSATAALGYARQAPDPVVRGRGLVAVAARLPEAERAAVLQEALDAARAAGVVPPHPPRTTDVLQAIAGSPIPDALAGNAVDVANEIESDDERAAALATLASALPQSHQRAALDQALDCTRNAASRVNALARVLTALPPEERTALAADALKQIVHVQEWQGEEHVTVSTALDLLALAPLLNGDQAAHAAEAALWIDDRKDRAAVLAALAPRVHDSVRGGVLGAARAAVGELDSKWDRADALVLLAPYLSSRELRFAMRVNTLGQDERLQRLAPHLPRKFVGRYLKLARKLYSDMQRAAALSALVPHITVDQRSKILPEAFALASRGPHPETLEPLAPYLDESQLRVALAATRIDDGDACAKALAALAPSLPIERAPDALAACAALSEEHERTERLVALAPRLPEPQLLQALGIARRSKDFVNRVRALAGITPYLPERERADALRDILAAIRDAPRGRLDGIAEAASIAELIQGDLQLEALDVLLRNRGRWTRTEAHAEVLAALAPQLAEPLLERALGQLGDPAGGRYPVHMLVMLAPHLPERLQPAALDAAAQLDSGAPAVLVALAPGLVPTLHERALGIARGTRSRLALATLAPYVSGAEIVTEAIHAIEDDPDPASIQALARGLTATRRPLTSDLQRALLEVTLALDSPGERGATLEALAPHLSGDLVNEALARGSRLTDNPAMVIADLAPAIPEPRRRALLNEALETVKSLGSPDSHFTLKALAPQLDNAQVEAIVAWVAASNTNESHPGPSVTDATWALMPVLTDASFEMLVRAALSVVSSFSRQTPLASMMGAADRVGPQSLNRAFGEWLTRTRLDTRENMLEELTVLTPAVARITPPAGIAQITDAIADVARWWP